ncbi:hypothetical protein [Streptomyces sp. NBC_00063]|uniref:hypothetical protein n=1 Tax=Streptomyces sp. NBC_00063 TaxID=2975638 RepID=UPI003D705D69
MHTLRSVADADALCEDLRTGTPRGAIVGAGLIGQEVAAAARGLGLETTLDPLPSPGAQARSSHPCITITAPGCGCAAVSPP